MGNYLPVRAPIRDADSLLYDNSIPNLLHKDNAFGQHHVQQHRKVHRLNLLVYKKSEQAYTACPLFNSTADIVLVSISDGEAMQIRQDRAELSLPARG